MFRTLTAYLRVELLLLLLLIVAPARAVDLELVAARDSTLYESPSGQLANGAGEFLYAGKTGQTSDAVRRLLVFFDLSEIPAGAAVTSARLSMTVSKFATSERHDFSLHRVLKDWGEGDSHATVQGQGQGTTAMEGDATWLHAVSPDSFWSAPGGDFVEEASDTIPIGFDLRYTWGVDGQLIDDVQQWVSTPSLNFGWLAIGNETESRSAKQFNSRTNPNAASRPVLTLSYELQVSPFDCNGDGLLDVNDLSCSCDAGATELDSLLHALGLVRGDLDGNGVVAFADFLVLAERFGQPGGYTDGDLDCNGQVAFADFLILAENFSENFGSSFAVQARQHGGLAAVPEPTSVTLFIMGMLWIVRGTRRLQS